MKKIFFLACVLSLYSFIAPGKTIVSGKSKASTAIPESLLTDDSVYWTTSTFSSLKYTNTKLVSGQNSYKDAGMVVKFKFKKENRFELLLYVQSNSYGAATETWTMIEGDVEFGKDEKGQNVFITHADKGNYKVVKNGRISNHSVQQKQLKIEYSNTYLWERINFPGDDDRTYLLTVNLDEHPDACVKGQRSIDRSWVTKFHIPVVK